MYTRTKTFTNKDSSTRTYLQIVEAVRENDKVRQKVLLNLGRLEELQKESLDRLIVSLAKYSKKKWIQAEAEKFMVHSAKEWGIELIFRCLWNRFGLDSILSGCFSQAYTGELLKEAVYAMVLNRISDPLSKRGVSSWIKEVYRPAFDQLELHHFYRALDFLAEHKQEIELDLFNNVRTIFDFEVDMVFWDTTSTYFEGAGPEELGAYGYSKDHRPDRIQIMIGIAITRQGIPIAHEVFPGNTSDVDTFLQIINSLRNRFNLTRVIFVGDRGMVSKKILTELEKRKIEYIVGMRMRSVKDINDVLKTGGRYKIIKDNLKVKEVWYDADRYIVCHNPVQAEYDKKAREEMIAKLQKKIKDGGIKSLIGNSGYRHFLSINKDTIVINQKTILEESRYDGKYVLRTNADLDTDVTALAYKDLWRVERAFRNMKSILDLRPVFHYKDSQVRGHIMVCFLALVLESALQRKIKEKGLDFEYTYLLRDLAQLKAVELNIDEEKYLCRTELTGNAYGAFKVLGIRPPMQIAPLGREAKLKDDNPALF